MHVSIYIFILGALSLAQRQNRWLASSREDRGVRAGRLKLQNAGRTRNLHAFFIVLLVERSQSTRAKQGAMRPKIERQMTQNRAEINEKIEPKPVPNQSWSVRGSPNAPGTHPGHARDALGMLLGRCRTSPGHSRDEAARIDGRNLRTAG